MMGWAVNSIAEAIEGSIPSLPILFNKSKSILTSSMAEQDTSNI